MQNLKILIGWSGNNYSASVAGDNIGGCVIATHKTLDGVKKALKSALLFHIEGCIKDGDVLPKWLVENNYEFEYELSTSALLHSLDGILTRSALSRVTGINQKLLGHYASEHRKPRQQQRDKIIKGIHEIGKNLVSVI